MAWLSGQNYHNLDIPEECCDLSYLIRNEYYEDLISVDWRYDPNDFNKHTLVDLV